MFARCAVGLWPVGRPPLSLRDFRALIDNGLDGGEIWAGESSRVTGGGEAVQFFCALPRALPLCSCSGPSCVTFLFTFPFGVCGLVFLCFLGLRYFYVFEKGWFFFTLMDHDPGKVHLGRWGLFPWGPLLFIPGHVSPLRWHPSFGTEQNDPTQLLKGAILRKPNFKLWTHPWAIQWPREGAPLDLWS